MIPEGSDAPEVAAGDLDAARPGMVHNRLDAPASAEVMTPDRSECPEKSRWSSPAGLLGVVFHHPG